jgi:hypothetical protein
VGDLLFGEPGLLVEAPDPLLSGDVMATCHLDRPVRSAVIKHVDTSDVLLMVPVKTSDVLLQSSATRTTGRTLQRPGCNLFFFQEYLCKFWDVNRKNFM